MTLRMEKYQFIYFLYINQPAYIPASGCTISQSFTAGSKEPTKVVFRNIFKGMEMNLTHLLHILGFSQ